MKFLSVHLSDGIFYSQPKQCLPMTFNTHKRFLGGRLFLVRRLGRWSDCSLAFLSIKVFAQQQGEGRTVSILGECAIIDAWAASPPKLCLRWRQAPERKIPMAIFFPSTGRKNVRMFSTISEFFCAPHAGSTLHGTHKKQQMFVGWRHGHGSSREPPIN